MTNPFPDFKEESSNTHNEVLQEQDDIPKLPESARYGLAGEIVDLASQNSEADPVAVLVSVLVTAGAMTGPDVYVRVGDTKHPARLYIAKVGTSAKARKGTSESPVKRIFDRCQELCFTRMPSELNSDYQESIIQNPLRTSPGPLSSGEGIIHQVRDASDEENHEGNPIDPGEDDKRLLVIDEELGGALRSMQRDGNTLSAILRGAWDHGNIEPLTKTSRIKATGAHVCIIGHITLEELKALFSKVDIWNGLANRFLWCLVHRRKLVAIPKPLPHEKVEELARRLGSALIAASNCTEYTLTANAEASWIKIYPELSSELPGALGAVTARSEPQVLRLALIYAILDGSEGLIDTSHLHAAIAVWEYCLKSAEYIFKDVQKDPDLNKIIAALKNGPKTQTEISRIFSGHKKKRQIEELLKQLVDADIIVEIKQGTEGRPVTRWRLIEA